MDPETEAKSKITRIDKDKFKEMEFEEEDVVRARYLMSPFNLREANLHRRRNNAALVFLGVFFIGAAATIFLLTLCSKWGDEAKRR